VGRGHFQGHGEAQQVEQRDIPFAAFHLANIVGVEASAVCEVFLGEAFALPERADGGPQERARGILAGTIGTG
jgi:hypothetical protein